MKDKDFKFLVMRDPDNGLVFVSLDSMVGYIRYLAKELDEIAFMSEDAASTQIISRAFFLLSDRFEDMEEINGRGKITDI
jgi:hypothetical protein